jgi:hypothetical protein
MAQITIDQQGQPSTPAAGKDVVWVDSGTGALIATLPSGRHTGSISRNDATASQALGTGDTYVTNSGLLLPSFGMKQGQFMRWFLSLSKTAAGTAQAAVNVRIGAFQSTSDTARLTLTQAAAEAQSALAASAIMMIMVGVRSVSATGVIAGGFGFTQTYQATAGNLAFGGGQDGASSTFANDSLAGQYVGISINAGASSAWTITHCTAELIG